MNRKTLGLLLLSLTASACNAADRLEYRIHITGHGSVSVQPTGTTPEVLTCEMESCSDSHQLASDEGIVIATPAADWLLESLTRTVEIPGASPDVSTFESGDLVNLGNDEYEVDIDAVFFELSSLCDPTTDPAGEPTVTTIFPVGGVCAEGSLYIRGTNLGGVGTCVILGGEVLTVAAGSTDTELIVPLPAGFPLGPADLTILTLQGQVVVTEATVVADAPAPTATSFTPTSAAVGESVVVTGTEQQDVTRVQLLGPNGNGDGTITAQDSTTVTFTVPNLPSGFYTLRVGNPCGSADPPGSLTIP